MRHNKGKSFRTNGEGYDDSTAYAALRKVQEEEQRKILEITTTNADIAKQEREVELKAKEAEVKEQELAASIKKQAEAEKYRIEQNAQAELFKRQKEAEAKKYEETQRAGTTNYIK